MPPAKGKRRPPYIVREVTRHKRVVWYFRQGEGPRLRLPDEYGSEEFWKAYNAALVGIKTPRDGRRIEAPAGSLGWLIQQYKKSAAFAALAPSTKRNRDRLLATIAETGGNLRLAEVDRAMLVQGRDRRAETPAQANIFLKTMRIVLDFALEANLIEFNPAVGVKSLKQNPEGFHTWTVDEVEAYEARHPVGTKARLALDLMLYTGLRRSDVVTIGRRHIDGDVLSIQPMKTKRTSGVVVTIRVLPVLAESISATEDKGERAFLVTEFGKPFTSNGFGNWFRKRCDEAGVSGSAHGLRKAAATRCAENGATAHELMAMFGWTTVKEAERYTRAAERRRLGISGSRNLLSS